MPVPIAESSNIEWIDNNGVKFPFRRENVGYDGHGPVNPVQFETTGTVTAAFLNAGALAHTLKFTITADDIDAVKDLVRNKSRIRRRERFSLAVHRRRCHCQ
jgi:hypothetical protein